MVHVWPSEDSFWKLVLSCHSRCWACIASTVAHGASLLVPGYSSWKHLNVFCSRVTFVIAHCEWESKRPPTEQSVWSLCDGAAELELVLKSHRRRPCTYFIFLFLFFNAFATQNKLTDLEILALLIAALSHDLDHRGVNNSYIQR